MKKVLSYQEIIDLIHFIPDSELLWIDNDNLRKEHIKEFKEMESSRNYAID